MAYEKGSAELIQSCKRICEILETGYQRSEHTGLKRYLPKSPWVRALAYKAGVPKDNSVYLTNQERQELAYHYRKVSGSMRGMEKGERPSLVQQLISKAYEMRKGKE